MRIKKREKVLAKRQLTQLIFLSMLNNVLAMARKWTNRNMLGALHFVTGNVLDRKPIFREDNYCRAFLEELQKLRNKNKVKVIAFIVMPDHFHFIANPKDGDIQTAAGNLKSFSAKRIVELAPDQMFLNGEENQVWQESFKALPLWSRWMISQKINYIHANPLKAGLCAITEDYPWSSFRSFYRDEKDPLFSVDPEWWWPGDEERIVESVKAWEAEKTARLAADIEKNRRQHLA